MDVAVAKVAVADDPDRVLLQSRPYVLNQVVHLRDRQAHVVLVCLAYIECMNNFRTSKIVDLRRQG